MNKSNKIRIVASSNVLGGKPRISGTRISVDIISHYISSGYSVFEIKKSYPHLTDAQIGSALDYLKERASSERGKLEPTTA